MITIAMAHRKAARHLLAEPDVAQAEALMPVTSLLYLAIELTLKAYVLQDYQRLPPLKGLLNWYEQAEWLELSREERELLKQLGQQQAFAKALDYALWDNPQQLQVFAHRLLNIHQRLLDQMPLELHPDYWS